MFFVKNKIAANNTCITKHTIPLVSNKKALMIFMKIDIHNVASLVITFRACYILQY